MIALIAKKLAAIAVPIVINAVADEIKAQAPGLIRAVVVAITETMGNLAVKATDQVTDIIPGELDDRMVDGFVKNVFEHLHRLGL